MKLPKLSKAEKLHLAAGLLSPFVIAVVKFFRDDEISNVLAPNSGDSQTVSAVLIYAGIVFILVMIMTGVTTFMFWARSIKRPSPGLIEPVQQKSWNKEFIASYWAWTAVAAAGAMIN